MSKKSQSQKAHLQKKRARSKARVEEAARKKGLKRAILFFLFCVLTIGSIAIWYFMNQSEESMVASVASAKLDTASAKEVKKSQNLPEEVRDPEDLRQFILGKLNSDFDSGNYAPVFIYRNDSFDASGVLYTEPGKSKSMILTNAHVFPEGWSGYYTYQILRPFSEKRHPISEIIPISGFSNGGPGVIDYNQGIDMVACIPGESKLIHGLPGIIEGKYPKTFLSEEYPERYEGLTFTSILSGEVYPCVGVEIKPSPVKGSVLINGAIYPYGSIDGESGTGLIASDGRLLIHSASLDGSSPERFGLEPGTPLALGKLCKPVFPNVLK